MSFGTAPFGTTPFGSLQEQVARTSITAFRRAVRKSQPRGPVPLNHQAFPGLTLQTVFLGSAPEVELVSGSPTTINAFHGVKNVVYGDVVGFGNPQTSGNSLNATWPEPLIPADEVVLFGSVMPKFSPNGIPFIYRSASYTGSAVNANSGPVNTDFTLTIFDSVIFSPTVPTDQQVNWALRIKAGAHALYVNGVLLASSTSGTTQGLSPSLVVCDTASVGLLVSARGVNTSDARLKALSENPWAVFQPDHIPIFAIPPSRFPKDGTKIRMLRKVVRTSQPPVGTPINWGHRFSQHLSSVYLYGRVYQRGSDSGPIAGSTPRQGDLIAGDSIAQQSGTSALENGYLFEPSILGPGVDTDYTLLNETRVAILRSTSTEGGGISYSIARGTLNGFLWSSGGTNHGISIPGQTSIATSRTLVLGSVNVIASRLRYISGVFGEGTVFTEGVRDASGPYNQTIRYGAGATIGGGAPALAPSKQNHAIPLHLSWNYAWSDSEIAEISANPWQIFEPEHVPLFEATVTIVEGVSRPSSDIALNGWTSTAATLFDAINEVALDRADHITSPDLVQSATMGLLQPLAAGNFTVRVDAARLNATGDLRVVLLNDANAAQGQTAWTPLASTPTTYELPVSTSGASTRFRIEVRVTP